MAAMNVLPPVPAVYGEGWRDEWLPPDRRHRAVAAPLARGAGRRAVLAPRIRCGPTYERIDVPDDDRRGLGRRLHEQHAPRRSRRCRCPKRVLVGPWSHMSTATSIPGPHIDLVPELIRWFAPLAARRAERRSTRSRRSRCSCGARRGRRPISPRCAASGASEPSWPAGARRRSVAAARTGDESTEIAVRGDVGTAAWISCAGKPPWGAAGRPARGRRALAHLRLGAARGRARDPRASAVRADGRRRRTPSRSSRRKLCDVFPDGTSALVSRGVLNLTHRDWACRARAARARRPDGGRARARSDLVDLRGGPPRAPGARGRRLAEHLAAAARRLARRSRARRVELELPVVDGPPDRRAAAFRPLRRRARSACADAEEGQPRSSAPDRPRRGRAARRASSPDGSTLRRAVRRAVEERYDGAVGVAASNPGRAWASAAPDTTSRGRRTTVATEAH